MRSASMRRRVTAVSCLVNLVFLGMASIVYADGFILKLPEDGTRVFYSGVFKAFEADADNKAPFKPGDKISFELASVGKEIVKGQPCRWIEFSFAIKDEEGEMKERFLVLYPEKYLAEGQQALEHVIRGAQARNGKPQPGVGRRSFTDFDSSPLGLFVGAPSEKRQDIAMRKVKVGDQTYDCAGVRQVVVGKKRSNKRLKVELSTWRNENVPFGVAAAEMKIHEHGSTVTVELSVVKIQKNAKPSIPLKAAVAVKKKEE